MDTQTITIKTCDWSGEVYDRLKPACDDHYTIDELKQDCLSKQVSLFGVYNDNRKEICNFVLRLEEGERSSEMVVVVGGGKLKGASLFNVVTPYIEEIARKCGAQYIRGHVNSKAKAKLMEKAGYLESEIVFRKAVDHGRQIQ